MELLLLGADRKNEGAPWQHCPGHTYHTYAMQGGSTRGTARLTTRRLQGWDLADAEFVPPHLSCATPRSMMLRWHGYGAHSARGWPTAASP